MKRLPGKIYSSLFITLGISFLTPVFAQGASSAQCDEVAQVCMMSSRGHAQHATFQQNPDSSTTPVQPFGDDLSEKGEAEYVAKIKKWLNSLPLAKREIATTILSDSHNEMHALRKAIYEKKLELAGVRFDSQESLKKLPRLGMDLQKLRLTLRQKLEILNKRLKNEAGIEMNELVGEGLWLQPLIKRSKPAPLGVDYGVPISMWDSQNGLFVMAQ